MLLIPLIFLALVFGKRSDGHIRKMLRAQKRSFKKSPISYKIKTLYGLLSLDKKVNYLKDSNNQNKMILDSAFEEWAIQKPKYFSEEKAELD